MKVQTTLTSYTPKVHKLIALRLPASPKIPSGVSTEYDYPVLSLSGL